MVANVSRNTWKKQYVMFEYRNIGFVIRCMQNILKMNYIYYITDLLKMIGDMELKYENDKPDSKFCSMGRQWI